MEQIEPTERANDKRNNKFEDKENIIINMLVKLTEAVTTQSDNLNNQNKEKILPIQPTRIKAQAPLEISPIEQFQGMKHKQEIFTDNNAKMNTLGRKLDKELEKINRDINNYSDNDNQIFQKKSSE